MIDHFVDLRTTGILAEHQNGAGVSVDVLAVLLRERVDMEAICRRVKNGVLDPPRLDRVTYTSNTAFEFSVYTPGMAGVVAMIFVVRDHIGDPIDLAAWNGGAQRPALWCSRGSLLGAESLFGFRIREALEIHLTPLEWLRAGCRGVVILDPTKAAPLLRRAEPLQASSVAHGRALRRMLEVKAPRIVVPASAERGAT